jgi:triosephosphate isomerase
MARQLIAGNWKMNGLLADAAGLAGDLAGRIGAGEDQACEWLVCPPAALLYTVAQAVAGSALALGGQDCHRATAGAHTGDTSPALLADLGCSYVIVGHSERRSDHGEDDATVKAKAEGAVAAGLTPIVCVGETRAERDAGRALAVIESQVRGSLPLDGDVVVAYEPVWAIGTGLTATAGDVAEVHAAIHKLLQALLGAARVEDTRILYGGSVKPGNAAELLAVPHVGGALVGGASLNADDFLAIGAAAS